MAFIYLLYICSVIICGVLSSEVGNGVCVVTWSTVKTTRVSYIHTWHHTYWGYCGWERCQKSQLKSTINYKIRYEDQPHRFEYCCNGYKRESLDDKIKCSPVCNPTCTNGNCTGPGVCTCWPGYDKLSSSRCAPRCDPPCVQGKCVGHNTCECDTGYKRNETASHVCHPACDPECTHAECVAPDSCQCLPGYQIGASPNHCVPKCFDNCVHGTCIAPYDCKCNNGYTSMNQTCVPECSRECEYSECDSPEHCQCYPGYTETNDWNVCEPHCEQPCVNAYCSDPNVCTCFDNYKEVNNTVCEPICTQTCVNGKCVSPDLCECNPGYEPGSKFEVSIPTVMIRYEKETNNCVPQCEPNCVNGECTAPNECSCYQGFEKSEFDENVCEPRCFSNGCLNGNCTEPNVCTCADGYIKVNSDNCLAICRDDENNCEDDFEKCREFSDECVLIGRHYIPKLLTHYNRVNTTHNLDNIKLSLDWNCNEIFNTISERPNVTDNCQNLIKLHCGVQINMDSGHIDFICGINTNPTVRNINNSVKDHIIYNVDHLLTLGYNATITLIHPKEFYDLKKGKCDLCLCQSNLEYSDGEILFEFTTCPKHAENLKPEGMLKDTPFVLNYVYIIGGVAIIVVLTLISLIVYRVRVSKSSYGVRCEADDGQELKVEEEFLVCTNNGLEED